jgi:uncharacterized damage-inducible protein DinB
MAIDINILRDFSTFPVRLKSAVQNLSEKDVLKQRREGGWTVKQILHHIAEAQTMAYFRVKWALTEENLIIKPFDQDKWSILSDKDSSVDSSVKIIEGIYEKFHLLISNNSNDEMKKVMHHPESGDLPLEQLILNYYKHGENHLAQIIELNR